MQAQCENEENAKELDTTLEYDIVISGISGRYPKCKNLNDLEYNLYNMVDMISDDEVRWPLFDTPAAARNGYLNNLEKFDADFFNITNSQAHAMDVQCRFLLETVYESILDAGINPKALRNTKTGVFVCTSSQPELEKIWLYEKPLTPGFGLIGTMIGMFANHISYFLGFQGPSVLIDSACSSLGSCFDKAVKAIRNGEFDTAIVAGIQISLNVVNKCATQSANVISPDGYCKTFDISANGFTRSETCNSFILQKIVDAKRNYCTIIHTKLNSDGFKTKGIHHPSEDLQAKLFEDFYQDVQIQPSTVSYIEAHGTGTSAGDLAECTSINKIFCKNRNEPLKIGSIKSSIGHGEPAAIGSGIIKSIFIFETNFISPNIHLRNINTNIPALKNGSLQPITTVTKFEGSPLIGVNAFGFGGSNSHILLKQNMKLKTETKCNESNNLPRLVLWAGRNDESREHFIQMIECKPLDIEFISLVNNIHQDNVCGYDYRGIGIYECNSSNDENVKCFYKASSICNDTEQKIIWLYSGLKSEWKLMNNLLFHIPIFTESIKKCHVILTKYNVNLTDIIMPTKPYVLNSIQNVVIGIIAVQIGITDTLKGIKMKCDRVVGKSIGIITSLYAKGLMTMEETLFIAHLMGNYLLTGGYNDKISNICSKTMTIPQLDSINVSKKIIENFASVIQCDISMANNLSLKQIFHHLMQSEEEFSKKSSYKKQNTLLIEISSNLKTSTLYNKTFISENSTLLHETDNTMMFLKSIAKIFLYGHNMDVNKFYPPISYPVSRGTSMISPLIKWDHKNDYYTLKMELTDGMVLAKRVVNVSLDENEFSYLSGHVVDGKCLIPATFYMKMAWDLLAILGKQYYFHTNVVLKDIVFLRATELRQNEYIKLTTKINCATGAFEILENIYTIATGYVFVRNNPNKLMNVPKITTNNLVMETEDFYKELRLRGYQYSGLFKSIINIASDSSNGKIKWQSNFVAFMDCVLQSTMLIKDTRDFMLPVKLKSVIINAPEHFKLIANICDDEKLIDVYCNEKLGVYQSGAIEFRGLYIKTVAKHVNEDYCKLDKYKFIPYIQNEQQTIEDAITVVAQLILENYTESNFLKMIEIDQTDNRNPIINLLHNLINKNSPIDTESIYLTAQEITLEGVEVKNVSIQVIENCSVVISSSITNEIIKAMSENSFLLSVEEPNRKIDKKILENFALISIIPVNQLQLVLLKRRSMIKDDRKITTIWVRSDDTKFEWLFKLKYTPTNDKLVLAVQDDPCSGIIGLVNCIRKEPNRHDVKCFFIDDALAPKFDVNHSFYRKQLDLDLTMNVLRMGQWGSYRHLLLMDQDQLLPEIGYSFANIRQPGNLSSFNWYRGSFKHDNTTVINKDIINVVYTAFNFRDVMLATGKLDEKPTARFESECILGFEYSGVNETGQRVMGCVSKGGLATKVSALKHFCFNVPNHWSLREAATCPVVYCTVYACLQDYIHDLKGKSILIHAGSGAVGLAAITVAIAYGMEIFTTVSTATKKKFLLKKFKELKERNIGNSRNRTFEKMIKINTKGIGVDFVLNSLTGQMIHASLQCVKRNGVFLEIGRYDAQMDNYISINPFMKNITYKAIMLTKYISSNTLQEVINLSELVRKDIESGIIKPIHSTVFQLNQLEKAVRLLTSGKHIGKVLIQIRKNENDIYSLPMSVIPQVYFKPSLVYILVGGLGGFGLEFADWMIIRGARNIVFNSRNGLTNTYQRYRINIWKSYKCNVEVDTSNVTSLDGCKHLLEISSKLGDIGGIFNLAVVLRDSVISNQTVKTFNECFAPKSIATKYLDELSRVMCPKLEHFVVFSSLTSGLGNAGQINYGMTNSIMERLMEKRVASNLPGIAIQWGPIGDVGVLFEMIQNQNHAGVSGYMLQSINSCTKVLDQLLTANEPIVSSCVINEKRSEKKDGDIVDEILNIIGVFNVNNISLSSTLAELGMESLSVIEVQNLLSRRLNINLNTNELRMLTINRLKEITSTTGTAIDNKISRPDTIISQGAEKIAAKWEIDETQASLITRVKTLNNSDEFDSCMIYLPGLDGISSVTMLNVLSHVNIPVFAVQFCTEECTTIGNIVHALIEPIKTIYKNKSFFYIVGYCYGATIGILLTKILEDIGMKGHLLLIDGSPNLTEELITEVLLIKALEYNTMDPEIIRIRALIEVFFEKEAVPCILDEIFTYPTFDEKWDAVIQKVCIRMKFSPEFVKNAINIMMKRFEDLPNHNFENFQKFKTPITLIRVPSASDNDVHDYGLNQYTEGEIEVINTDADHITVLEIPNLTEIINQHIPSF